MLINKHTSSKHTKLLILAMFILLLMVELTIIYQLSTDFQRRQLLVLKNSSTSSTNAEIQAVEKQFKDKIPLIDKAIPEESRFPEIVDKINYRISIYPDSQFKFDSNDATFSSGQRFGYFKVTISATVPSLEEATKLIKDLSENSFLYTTQDIDLNRRPDNESFKIVIKGNLYGQSIN